MARFLDTLDGTGRPLFPIQREFLEWLQAQTARVVAGQLPPGTGKSLIVRTIQRATGATVITPSNILVDQYSGTYPNVNVLKGQAHYSCDKHRMPCGDVRELGEKPCTSCPYREARRSALEGAPTFFNPISLFNLTRDANYERPTVTVVDEAHQLISMLSLVSGETFKGDKFRLPTSTHSADVLDWLKEQAAKVARVADFHGTKQSARSLPALRDKERLERVAEMLEADPTNYSIALATDKQRDGSMLDVLHVRPITPPKPLLERVLGTGRVILLSGTLSRLDAATLAPGEDFAYIDMPSPIPATQRQVLYRPFTPADDKALYDYVLALHKEFGGPTIVHVSYALSERLAKFAVSHLRNTPNNKESVVKRFKAEGGLFFAAGCAEGLDLPDGQCRLNIIPVLPRPNIGDHEVKKWLALPGGPKRYDLETLKTLQQQVGRSTRHVNDWSVTVVCDPRLPSLVSRNRGDISDSFYESIVWTGKRRGNT